jgi:hypothetical protein
MNVLALDSCLKPGTWPIKAPCNDQGTLQVQCHIPVRTTLRGTITEKTDGGAIP